jgi:hypothetical protein
MGKNDSGQDLYNELNYSLDELEASIDKLAVTGKKAAETEREYKIALSQKALELRDKGMAVTLIDKAVYGIREIADKRYERDVADVIYNANQENINAVKLRIRILDNRIDREWHRSND